MKDDIFRLRNLGYTYSQIQRELGCSKSTIAYYLGYGQKEKTLSRTRDRRSAVRRHVQEYKQSRGCMDCGEMYPFWVLDLDHKHSKSFNISEFTRSSSSLKRVIEEIEKCDVVCANCHRIRTFAAFFQTGSNSLDIDEYYTDSPR